MATSVRFALLFLAAASGPAHAQLTLPTWPPFSGNSTCNNIVDAATLALFSSNTAFAQVVLGALTYVVDSTICATVSDKDAAVLVARIKVCLCYGPTPADCQCESLANITKLLTGGHWNFSRSTTCFFPGWRNNPNSSDYSTEVMKAYNVNGTTNLLIVDWSSINSNLEYTLVVSYMPAVGRALAIAFAALAQASNCTVSKIVLVGHSLGAHLAGYSARGLKNNTCVKIPVLVALDPAGPLFSKSILRCQEGVLSTDALYVIGVHSDWGRFGIDQPVGKVDYMANNGTWVQPGCTPYDTNPTSCSHQFLCSHVRALLFWCDAVSRPASVVGRSCPCASEFAAGNCKNNPTNIITEPASTNGLYYFNTSGVAPYGLGINGA